MAEIKIVKKPPVWPWMLLALGAAVLIYYFFFRDKEAEQDVIEEVKDETSMIEKPVDQKTVHYTNAGATINL